LSSAADGETQVNTHACAINDRPIDTVAKIVGIPLSAVKTRMYYAKKHPATLLPQVGVDRTAL
jgi:DNA-directed RNA polymerase specialized sigma24 family protein